MSLLRTRKAKGVNFVSKINNELMRKAILEFDKVPVNEYSSTVNQSSNFISEAAAANDIKIIKPPKGKRLSTFTYKNQKFASMNGLKPSSTSRAAFHLCRDKFRLENFLSSLDITTLESKLFTFEEKNHAFNHIKALDTEKFVLKPLSLAGGLGIELNVDEHNFSEAWDDSVTVQKSNNVSAPSCIVQPFIQGFDVRVSIIEGDFAAASLRLPAHIVGNGQESIKELIAKKNEARAKIKYFSNKMIKIDDKLKKRLKNINHTIEDVPENNQIIILTDISNLTLGGESIDITESISEKIVNTALNATAAIPGLNTAGIDFMVNDYKEGDGYIIEVNTNANHTIHHVPLKGDVHYPFHQLIKSLLVKYKAEQGYEMDEKERVLLKSIWKFKKLKEFHAIKLFESSML